MAEALRRSSSSSILRPRLKDAAAAREPRSCLRALRRWGIRETCERVLAEVEQGEEEVGLSSSGARGIIVEGVRKRASERESCQEEELESSSKRKTQIRSQSFGASPNEEKKKRFFHSLFRLPPCSLLLSSFLFPLPPRPRDRQSEEVRECRRGQEGETREGESEGMRKKMRYAAFPPRF